jgi:hypothetical protein
MLKMGKEEEDVPPPRTYMAPTSMESNANKERY